MEKLAPDFASLNPGYKAARLTIRPEETI